MPIYIYIINQNKQNKKFYKKFYGMKRPIKFDMVDFVLPPLPLPLPSPSNWLPSPMISLSFSFAFPFSDSLSSGWIYVDDMTHPGASSGGVESFLYEASSYQRFLCTFICWMFPPTESACRRIFFNYSNKEIVNKILIINKINNCLLTWRDRHGLSYTRNTWRSVSSLFFGRIRLLLSSCAFSSSVSDTSSEWYLPLSITTSRSALKSSSDILFGLHIIRTSSLVLNMCPIPRFRLSLFLK